jgi:hypothetical protein
MEIKSKSIRRLNMSTDYTLQNSESRRQLKQLVESLSEDDLNCALPGDWTPALLFAHLAFWDQRICSMLEHLQNEDLGVPLPLPPLPAWALNSLNQAVRRLSAEIPPLKAARLAMESAEAVDQAIENLPAEFAKALESKAVILLKRSIHRRHHLEQISVHLKG